MKKFWRKLKNRLKRKNFWKKFFQNFVLALLFSFIMIIPDFVLRLGMDNYMAHFHANSFLFIFCLVSSLLFVKNEKFFNICYFLIWVLITSAMFYLIHFGRYFLGHDMMMLFRETEDIFIGLVANLGSSLYVIITGVLCFCLGYIFRKTFIKTKAKSNIFIYIFLSIIVWKLYNVNKLPDTKTLPNPLRYIATNSINSFSNFWVKSVFVDKKIKKFKPYTLVKKDFDDKQKITVIFIMGESTNNSSMSLFGYKRNTTPNLLKWKNKPNFIYKKAISSGVATSVSLPMFFNFQKEPENVMMAIDKKVNLFKMAEERGFKTLMFSPQASSTFADIGIEFIDRVNYRDLDRDNFTRLGDDYSYNLLKKEKLDDKNFFVIQMRALHYPYERIYENLPQFNKFNDENVAEKINAYDNAMLYLDDFLNRMLEYVDTLDGKVYFIFTSDHGQMMGENNLWGHSFLHRKVADVPFFIYTKNVSKDELFGIDKIKTPTHYDISKFIAKILGYEVKNPNTLENIYYINGNDIDGSGGFLKLEKLGQNLRVLNK